MTLHRLAGFMGGVLLSGGVGMLTVPDAAGLPVTMAVFGAALLGFVLGGIADRCIGG